MRDGAASPLGNGDGASSVLGAASSPGPDQRAENTGREAIGSVSGDRVSAASVDVHTGDFLGVKEGDEDCVDAATLRGRGQRAVEEEGKARGGQVRECGGVEEKKGGQGDG